MIYVGHTGSASWCLSAKTGGHLHNHKTRSCSCIQYIFIYAYTATQAFLQKLAAGNYTFSPTLEENFLLRFAQDIMYYSEGVRDEASKEEVERGALSLWMRAATACQFFGEWQPKDFIDSPWNAGAESFFFFVTQFALVLSKGGMFGPHSGGLVAHKCRLPLDAASFELAGNEVRIRRGGKEGEVVDEDEGDRKYGDDNNQCTAPAGMVELRYSRPSPSKTCPWITPYTYFAPKGSVEEQKQEEKKKKEKKRQSELGGDSKLLDPAYYEDWWTSSNSSDSAEDLSVVGVLGKSVALGLVRLVGLVVLLRVLWSVSVRGKGLERILARQLREADARSREAARQLEEEEEENERRQRAGGGRGRAAAGGGRGGGGGGGGEVATGTNARTSASARRRQRRQQHQQQEQQPQQEQPGEDGGEGGDGGDNVEAAPVEVVMEEGGPEGGEEEAAEGREEEREVQPGEDEEQEGEVEAEAAGPEAAAARKAAALAPNEEE
jgi:hypothetical protein